MAWPQVAAERTAASLPGVQALGAVKPPGAVPPSAVKPLETEPTAVVVPQWAVQAAQCDAVARTGVVVAVLNVVAAPSALAVVPSAVMAARASLAVAARPASEPAWVHHSARRDAGQHWPAKRPVECCAHRGGLAAQRVVPSRRTLPETTPETAQAQRGPCRSPHAQRGHDRRGCVQSGQSASALRASFGCWAARRTCRSVRHADAATRWAQRIDRRSVE